MISKHYFTFPAYIPRICRVFHNWPEYIVNYVLRKKTPTEYRTRQGTRIIDGTGTMAGTLAVVFIRREYGSVSRCRNIVDIGANMGAFALYAAESCLEAQVICYEPEERNFEFLRQNIAANGLGGRVSAIRAAVAGTGGRRELLIGESPLNSFYSRPSLAGRQSVECVTLKHILEDHKLDTIDLLKINCEGAEYGIFDNCADAELRRIDNIRMEYHNFDDAPHCGQSLASLLEVRGFVIERFSRYRAESGFIWATRMASSRRRALPRQSPRA